jgi:hypothetical protein
MVAVMSFLRVVVMGLLRRHRPRPRPRRAARSPPLPGTLRRGVGTSSLSDGQDLGIRHTKLVTRLAALGPGWRSAAIGSDRRG